MNVLGIQFNSLLNRISRLNGVVFLLVMLVSTSAVANQPFYFIAKQAPEGSLALQGANNKVV